MSREYIIRVFKRKRVRILITIVVLINFLDISNRVIKDPLKNAIPLQSAFNENILFNGSMYIAFILYQFVVFFLAALGLSDLIAEDMKTGFINIELTKKSKKEYLRKAYINNFIIGGLFAIFPILINILIWLTLRPTFALNFINSGFTNYLRFESVLKISPILFYIVVLLNIFVMGGIIASFSMYLNTKFKNMYIGLIAVLIIDVLIQFIMAIISDLLKIYIGFGGLTRLTSDIYFNVGVLDIIYLVLIFIIPIIYFTNLSRRKDFI